MKRIGVVGAGLMGAEIALVFALAGHAVLINDRDRETLDRAKSRLSGILTKGVERGFYNDEASEFAMRNITGIEDLADFANAEFVIEAVFESEDVKADLWRRLSEVCAPSALLASNTSTIPISTLASFIPEERRHRFLGTHFFSPVSRMKLVEVVPGFATSETAVDEVIALLQSAGKTTVRVKDVAGFAVNRMLHAFIIEAVRLVEEGVATPEDLDTACRHGLGHPMGPFALMDSVTASLCVEAQEIMQEAYGERFRPPALLKQRVRAGLVGGKGRQGWLQVR